LKDYGGLMSCFRDAVCFLALIDGEPAGGASLSFHDDVAALAGAGTLTMFRNRGVQTALLRARLDFARSRGSRLAMVSTRPGTVSQRNVERLGFRIAYTRTAFHREWS
jgi:GNAT superfamily N-acetyltransferase